MPRYFFHHLTKAGTIWDHEGTELPDLEGGRLEAIQDARCLMAEAMRAGRDISSRSVQICNATGDVLLTLPHRTAVIADD